MEGKRRREGEREDGGGGERGKGGGGGASTLKTIGRNRTPGLSWFLAEKVKLVSWVWYQERRERLNRTRFESILSRDIIAWK